MGLINVQKIMLSEHYSSAMTLLSNFIETLREQDLKETPPLQYELKGLNLIFLVAAGLSHISSEDFEEMQTVNTEAIVRAQGF